MSTAVANLETTLRARGQRATPQRLAIAAVVAGLEHHATADEISGLVAARVPGISLPTVYATLELLEELGLVRRVATESGTAVFDPRTDAHHHAVCRRCGAIVDIEAPADHDAVLRAAEAAGYRADEAQVIIRGVCAACRPPGATAGAT